MTLYTPVLWFYAVMVSLVFGASVYETLVVHPAWSRKPPESFRGFVGTPVSRMNIPMFWVPVAPLYALSGLAALGLALWTGSQGVAIIVSAVCAVAGVAWTLMYFRPTIERFLGDGRREHFSGTLAGRGAPLDSTQLGPRRLGRDFLVGSPQHLGEARMSNLIWKDRSLQFSRSRTAAANGRRRCS